MAKNELIDVDNGEAMRELTEAFDELNGFSVTVGIHREDNQEHPESDSGATLVDVAVFNEFGTRTIAARPFLRSTAVEQREKWAKLSGVEIAKVLAGRQTARKALDRIGTVAVADVRRKITTLRNPPNAPSTIRKKGSSNPLIDTGFMRGAIAHKVRRSSGTVEVPE